MGKSERSRTETQADDLGRRQKANRGGSACEMGEAEGGEEGCIASWEPAAGSNVAGFHVWRLFH